MTPEELEKIPFRFVYHMSLEDEHFISYSSDDNRLGFCDRQPYKDGQPYGKSVRHYRIDSNIYKSKKKFLEALENFSYKVVPIRDTL